MDHSALDMQHFRTLAERYAQAVDRNLPEILNAIMADDAIVEGPGFRLAGLAEILRIPALLRQQYQATRHLVHNQTVVIDGDQAAGETYCTASHLLREANAGVQVLVWHVRYQDRFSRANGQWRFTRRTLLIDWTETPGVVPPPADGMD